MFEESFRVRFYETDALKHVSNTTLVQWFESTREPIFKLFTPELDLDNWPLILANYHVDFLRQIFLGEVTLRTGIAKLGNSSFVVHQEVWQNGEKCAVGKTTMVHFNYESSRAEPLPSHIREELQMHLVAEE